MKKIFIILLLLNTVYAFSQSGVCSNFHRKNCGSGSKSSNGWSYNAQSKSGLFNQGMTSKIRCVIYKGMDYRINVCCETSFGEKLNYKIFDARTNEVLYDNAIAEDEPSFEFQSTATRQLIIEVTVPQGSVEKEDHKPSDAACVGLLIEHKVTNKQGFSSY